MERLFIDGVSRGKKLIFLKVVFVVLHRGEKITVFYWLGAGPFKLLEVCREWVAIGFIDLAT